MSALRLDFHLDVVCGVAAQLAVGQIQPIGKGQMRALSGSTTKLSFFSRRSLHFLAQIVPGTLFDISNFIPCLVRFTLRLYSTAHNSSHFWPMEQRSIASFLNAKPSISLQSPLLSLCPPNVPEAVSYTHLTLPTKRIV